VNVNMEMDTKENPIEPKKENTPLPAWQVVENSFDIENNPVQETLFALGNGYLGMRGSHEERFDGFDDKSADATFINGFYESSPLYYSETSYALAKEHQFMLTVPNSKCINFSLDNEDFDIFKGQIVDYNRSVDFRTGVLSRSIEWISPSNHQVVVNSQRLVSFTRKNIFAIQYQIKSVNFSGYITLHSGIAGRVVENENDDSPRYGAAVAAVKGLPLQLITAEQIEDFSALVHRTKKSGFTLVSAMENELVSDKTIQKSQEQVSVDKRVEQIYRIKVEAGDTITLTKYGAYFTSRENQEDELVDLAKDALKKARKAGFASLCSEQKEFLSDFWQHADVEISGDDAIQQGVHFSQFHLLQSIGRDGKTSIAAKGLTGEGYGGHYFWDAETYALPFYLYTKPEIARKMLEYRYSILDKSRARAREMSIKKGALYAWRTIAGEECSAYFPAGTAVYHINADIAYAIKQYYEATADHEFMLQMGAEILMETARAWLGIGAYIKLRNNQFCINEVTGPDEYTAMVDNNFYTNAMAQMHLSFAADIAFKIKKEYPAEFIRISKLMDLGDDEPAQWAQAAQSMYLPYNTELGIHPQDDGFLYKKVWDFAEMSSPDYDLPLHHHYLVIYRHQVCKQADVVLANFLLGDKFSAEDKKRNYDYYEAITTHDSSLSHCTFSIMASEVGYHEKAYEYFMKTARVDLDNLPGNTNYGVHIAAMSGAWMSVIFGFAGMRTYAGNLRFAPYLPDKWKNYSFRIYFQSQLLLVEVTREEVRYRLLKGEALQFNHYGVLVQLTEAAPIKVIATTMDTTGIIIKNPVMSGYPES
jgi:alpha,alpha-trehalose phosphorylase